MRQWHPSTRLPATDLTPLLFALFFFYAEAI